MTLNPQVWLGWGGHLFGEGTYQSMGANERKYNDAVIFLYFVMWQYIQRHCEVLHFSVTLHYLNTSLTAWTLKGSGQKWIRLRGRWPCVIFHVSPHSCHLPPIHFLALLPLGSPPPPPNNAPGSLGTLEPFCFICYCQQRLKIQKRPSLLDFW